MNGNLYNIFFFSLLVKLFVICSNSKIKYNHTSLENNLVFVFSTFRHGARYPFIEVDYLGNEISTKGKLTTFGEIQNLEIGKKYRDRYSNFLDMNFNPKQIYIRSSDIGRVIISTLKQLEGFFNKTIETEYLDKIKYGWRFWELFELNQTQRQEYDKYFEYCDNYKIRRLPNINDIFPILAECFGYEKVPNVDAFCDSVIASYFEYTYNNQTNNKIGKCGKESAEKMYQFCVETFDTYRGWDEKAAYMFYNLFKNIFKYMFDAIKKKSEIKMVMIGGHEITVDKFMDFLDGLKIINRTHYPHYACNIVIELRKYNNEYYTEFYYNDILKYNKTLKYLMDTLDNSKYSNLYNYCGYPNYSDNYIIKVKLKKFFRQKNDFGLYIILISIIITIFIIFFLIILFIYKVKKRNKFTKVKEEQPKKNVYNSLNNSIISIDVNS